MANAGTGSTVNLLSLPTETMEAVANELPTKDLPSLRLACKDIDSKITRPFERRCMTDKTFVLGSPTSMQKLATISNHPRFSKMLTRITFVLQQLHYSELEPGLKKWVAERKAEAVTLSGEQRAEYFRLRHMYQAIIHQQAMFSGNLVWSDNLSKCLTNLGARKTDGLAVTITSDRQQCASTPPDFDILQGTLGIRAELRAFERQEGYAVHMLKAMSKSRLSLSELMLPDQSWTLTLQTFGISGWGEYIAAESCIPRIRVLDLTIQTTRSVDQGVLDGLRRLLHASPHLASLRLRNQEARIRRIQGMAMCGSEFTEVVTASFMPCLEYADLELPFGSRTELISFVQRHNGSIQQLQLHAAGIFFPFTTTISIEAEQLASDAGVEGLEVRILERAVEVIEVD